MTPLFVAMSVPISVGTELSPRDEPELLPKKPGDDRRLVEMECPGNSDDKDAAKVGGSFDFVVGPRSPCK